MDTCFLFYQLQSILLALQLTLRLIMPISHLTTTFQNKSLSSFPIPHTYLVPCVDIPVQQFSKLLPSIIAKHKTSQSMPTLYFSSSINLHQKTLIFLGLPILLVPERAILHHTTWYSIVFLGNNSIPVILLGSETTTMHMSHLFSWEIYGGPKKTSRQWQHKVISANNGNQRAPWGAHGK